MFRKLAATAALATTLAAGFAAAPAEARHHYRYDGYHQNYYNGYHGYRGYRGRCYDKGNGGLAIGAVAGGLLGNTVAGHHDKLLGTVLGAAGGGLVGRAIDRSDGRPC